MTTNGRPPGVSVVLAYAISAAATLVWVGCVLPAGRLATVASEEMTTPMSREPWLLVPALVLLVAAPAGMALTWTRFGLLAILAATDALVALTAADLFRVWGLVQGWVSGVLVGLLYLLGLLSVVETLRLLRGGARAEISPQLRGLRLAICLLALLTPAWLLVQDGRELASLLAPYAYIAISAGGVLLSRGHAGLRLTAAIQQIALAIHILLVLRYTLFEVDPSHRPPFQDVSVIGWATIGTAISLLVFAAVLALSLRRASPHGTLAPHPEPPPAL